MKCGKGDKYGVKKPTPPKQQKALTRYGLYVSSGYMNVTGDPVGLMDLDAFCAFSHFYGV